ncbi:MAG: DNA repair protein RadC [Acidobacteriota bacterium]
MAVMDFAIRDLPNGERPRERLLRDGAQGLSDAELVAVLLRSGRRGHSALAMAMEILRQAGGLEGLLGSDATRLQRPGLGPAKASSVLAALEIGRRLARAEMPARAPLDRPAAVARYLNLRYGLHGQEVMGVLFLDARNRLTGERELFRGTLQRAVAEPREILREALLHGAAGLLLFHTHPSGDPSPSAQDLVFTRRVADSGDLLGVLLVDHMIVGRGGRWTSLRQHGGW